MSTRRLILSATGHWSPASRSRKPYKPRRYRCRPSRIIIWPQTRPPPTSHMVQRFLLGGAAQRRLRGGSVAGPRR